MKRNSFQDGSIGIIDYAKLESKEIEETLLCELLMEPSEIRHVAGIVKADMFTEGDARNFWNGLMKLDSDGKTPDMILVKPYVSQDYLADIVSRYNGGVSLTNISNHAADLRMSYFKRRTVIFAQDLIKSSYCEPTSEEAIINMASNFIRESEENAVLSGIQNMTELGNELADILQQGDETHVRTGFPRLDGFLSGGFPPGALIILAGRPGHGKTSIACYMMKKIAESGTPVVMFCLEQTNLEVYKKLLSGTGFIFPAQFINMKFDWKEYEKGVAELIRCPITLDEVSRSYEEISSRISILHRKKKCGIAFVDYLGLIPARPTGGMTKSQAVGEITHRFKNLARDLKIPIVLLCQLNRDMSKENRAPILTDLRDSGDIEQDADKVLMINRIDSADSCKVELWIRKNRQGRSGDIRLWLQPNETFTAFYETSDR